MEADIGMAGFKLGVGIMIGSIFFDMACLAMNQPKFGFYGGIAVALIGCTTSIVSVPFIKTPPVKETEKAEEVK